MKGAIFVFERLKLCEDRETERERGMRDVRNDIRKKKERKRERG